MPVSCVHQRAAGHVTGRTRFGPTLTKAPIARMMLDIPGANLR